MTIKEIEERSGMLRSNIRFYERNGLICPSRQSNKYRDYSESDFEELMRIKLLRGLGITIEEIKSLQAGADSLADALQRRIAGIRGTMEDAGRTEKLCAMICDDKVEYSGLDGEKYLSCDVTEKKIREELPAEEENGNLKTLAIRRVLARIVDMNIYTTVWLLILRLAFGASEYILPDMQMIRLLPTVAFRTTLISPELPDMLMTFFTMLIIEPVLLNLWGTTAGKWIFGLRVFRVGGRKPNYKESVFRCLNMFWYGFGLGINGLVTLILWIVSFRRMWRGDDTQWDINHWLDVTTEKTSIYNGIALTAALAAILCLPYIADTADRTPPNTGDLTVSEYAENFNYLSSKYNEEYFNGRRVELLNHEGEWTGDGDLPLDGFYSVYASIGNVYYMLPGGLCPSFGYTVSDGGVVEKIEVELLSHDGEETPNVILGINRIILMAALSYADGDINASAFSSYTREIKAIVTAVNTFDGFSFALDGMHVTYDVQYSGYELDKENEVLRLSGDEENAYFACRLTIQKSY